LWTFDLSKQNKTQTKSNQIERTTITTINQPSNRTTNQQKTTCNLKEY
jgi:hypothetical protein